MSQYSVLRYGTELNTLKIQYYSIYQLKTILIFKIEFP